MYYLYRNMYYLQYTDTALIQFTRVKILNMLSQTSTHAVCIWRCNNAHTVVILVHTYTDREVSYLKYCIDCIT